MASPPAEGRPGNLTAEQEAKLKDLWQLVFKTFGVRTEDEAPTPPTDVPADQVVQEALASHKEEPIANQELARTDTKLSTKKEKKGRFGFLKRDKKEKTTETLAPTPASTSASPRPSTERASAQSMAEHAATDDKYGQTKDFLSALESQTPAQLRTTFWQMVKADNPDGLLLRFLRARKWDAERALVMLIATMHWRAKEQNVEELVATGENYSIAKAGDSTEEEKTERDFIQQLRMGKSFLHGADKDGRPCCIVRVRLHKAGEQTEKSLEKYTVYTIETARLVLVPPVDTACLLFDMTGFGLANMDYTPVKFMIKCFEAHYPESLGHCLVYRAPWVFQGIWQIIKPWLDPVVAAKVHFCKSVDDLKEFIPEDQIIKELGGKEDWEYVYPEPSVTDDALMRGDENEKIRERLWEERWQQVHDFEDATRKWYTPGPDSADGKTQREEMAKKLTEGYWKMDPYIRARSMYDRQGLIRQGGVIDFYPKKEDDPVPIKDVEALAIVDEKAAEKKVDATLAQVD